MVTSLAAQLSKGVSLNATLLADRSRRKHTETYLFTSREADQLDFHSLYSLGVTGLSKLNTLNSKFSSYEDDIFSDSSRDLDRTLQSSSENAALDLKLGSLLKDLGPYLLEAPSSKVLEWLVRRFRVNEFNLDDVMAVFLPYHDTAHFVKMLSIMHIEDSRVWSFLAPVKVAGKPLPRSILVDEMLKSVELARFVITLLPESLGAQQMHRTLIGFTAGVTIDYLTRMKVVNEEIIVSIVPAAMRLFAQDSNADCALAGYITLAVLSQRCRLSSKVLGVLLTEVLKRPLHIEPLQFLPLVIAILGPQDELEQFPDSLIDSLLRISGFAEALSECLHYVGVEKLIIPLLPSLIRRANEKVCFDAIDLVLTTSSISHPIIERITLICMETSLHPSHRSDPELLQLLSTAYQIHGAIFSTVYADLLKAERDAKKRLALEEILRYISLPSSATLGDKAQWVISSQTADVNARNISVKEILKALNAGSTDPDLYDALRARVMDTCVTVIEALYSDPQIVLPFLCNLPYIESLSQALAAPGISRSVMRLHLAFIANEICDHDLELAPAIFERIYLPFILFTKPRQKTAMVVWQSLRNSKLASYELFAGCDDIVFPQGGEDAARSIEEFMPTNVAVAAKIAGNIMISNLYRHHLDMLLRLLASSDVHTTIVAHMILRSLLDQLSGEHRVDAAHRVLTAMGLKSLDVLQDVANNYQDAILESSLSKSIALKPNSATTIRRLQMAILASLPSVPRPVGLKIDWLCGGCSGSSDTRGKRFADFTRAIYALANSSSVAQDFSTGLIRALFVNLRDETLLFLSGIWSTDAQLGVNTSNLRCAALFHGAAFLKARSEESEPQQDFQVILPSLLIALASMQRPVREVAMNCISIIEQSSRSTTGFAGIYAFDSVYGKRSDGLQYLDQSDFSNYVSSLNSNREYFINDGDYIGAFHRDVMCGERGKSKKGAGYRYRLLCYILSHILAWPSLEARVALMGMIKDVSSPAKLQMLLPLIGQLIPSNMPDSTSKGDTLTWNVYCRTLLGSFDESTTRDLNEIGSGSWTTFMRLFHVMFSTDASPAIRETILRQLRSGLFRMLTVEHQLEICIALIESAVAQPDYDHLIKETFRDILINSTLMTSLLAHFQPSAVDSSQRMAKRVKTVSNQESGSTEPTLRPLTFILEILIANKPSPSLELISSAIEVLTRVFHSHSIKYDANYLMQILMSLVESQASSLVGNITSPPGSVRMEILVELLRVSDNPQTINQALLLIASLARLSPETVMQSVMPVFTFMGSNVFQRDDTSSFRVVQKTVESIVPVMINSLRVKHVTPLDLQIASRDFLHVFTDASTHVPRHRRTRFFNHLVEVLGAEEFAVPICLLLLDKLAIRIVRQQHGDIASALSLPLAILKANFQATPFKIIQQILREAFVLLVRITEVEGTPQDAFLELRMDGEQISRAATKVQIQAILIFVDRVLEQYPRKGATVDEASVRESVRMLLVLSDPNSGPSAASEFQSISGSALKVLGRLLRVISAVEFVSCIVAITSRGNPAVESGAMNLLSSRLPNIAPKTRREISPSIMKIAEHACESMKDSQDLQCLKAHLSALSAICKTALSSETSGLTKAVPIVLHLASRRNDLITESLDCMVHLSAAIGPRILPFLRDVVELCSAVLKESTIDGEQSRIEEVARSIIISLLSSLSQFWSINELTRVATLSLDARPAPHFRRMLAKHISPKQLLPTLFQVWSDVATGDFSRKEAFFDLFKRVLRSASREDVYEHLRNTFKLFLEAFDVVGTQEHEDSSGSALLAAFVDFVTKLNEATFKPLFRRLFDWAFDEVNELSKYRQVTFCRSFTTLIKLLKGLITPYMSIVLVPLIEKLDSYNVDTPEPSSKLWESVLELFQTSLDLDEGAFWRSDQLRKLMPSLVTQIDVCPSSGVDEARETLKSCLNAFAAVTNDDALLKSVNLEILMKTRSEDPQVRQFALECARCVWQGNGDKLSGFVTDMVTFIAECAEDENDEVAREARKLRKTVESKCGGLDMLMQ